MEKCRGLKSTGIYVFDNEDYRIINASLKVWFDENVNPNYVLTKEENKLMDELFAKLIKEVGETNKTLRKVSVNNLKAYNFSEKVKEAYMAVNGSWRDYYILGKEKYYKFVWLVSIWDK